MPAYKEKDAKTWYVSVRYEDWTGKKTRKVKRGFATKREALEWERKFLLKENASLDMTFDSFLELYKEDLKDRLKLSTWIMKTSVIDQKILPYFKNKRMCDIKTSDVIAWQKEIMAYRDEDGNAYTPTYLKTIHNQLSAIFNHAVRYEDWTGKKTRKVKRGFATKREALEWERKFLLKENASLDMTFDSFLELYKEDLKDRLKLSTWIMKTSVCAISRRWM